MIIRVDEEGKQAVTELCDAALKVGGIRNLHPVTNILRSVEMLPSAEKPDQGDQNDGEDRNGQTP